MCDFSAQKEMFNVAKNILDSLGISKYALGGGTALSAHYWQHRNSTDIDIFLFEEKSHIRNIRSAIDQQDVLVMLEGIGYKKGNIKFPGNYLEIEIDRDRKIQFFENKKHHCLNACSLASLWGHEVYLEHINEIIYKKLYFRAEKKNSRDIFDVAMALNKNPLVFKTILQHQPNFIENLTNFKSALNEIINSEHNKEMISYRNEINYIAPSLEYQTIANAAPEYLFDYLEVFFILAAHKNDDTISLHALEDEVFRKIVCNSNETNTTDTTTTPHKKP